jgi:hypothetical protein
MFSATCCRLQIWLFSCRWCVHLQLAVRSCQPCCILCQVLRWTLRLYGNRRGQVMFLLCRTYEEKLIVQCTFFVRRHSSWRINQRVTPRRRNVPFFICPAPWQRNASRRNRHSLFQQLKHHVTSKPKWVHYMYVVRSSEKNTQRLLSFKNTFICIQR